MGNSSTTRAVYALVQLLLFHLSSLVATVDFIFYKSTTECAGDGILFENIEAYICCIPNEVGMGSVSSVSNVNLVEISLVELNLFYGEHGCSKYKSGHENNVCVTGGGYTGAGWVPITSQSLLADDAKRYEASKTCNAQTKPTGITYSEDSTKGHWILTTDNATEMYSRMGNIPYAEKVNWLQAHGATFKPGL